MVSAISCVNAWIRHSLIILFRHILLYGRSKSTIKDLSLCIFVCYFSWIISIAFVSGGNSFFQIEIIMVAQYTVSSNTQNFPFASAFHDIDTDFNLFIALVSCLSSIMKIFIYNYLGHVWFCELFVVGVGVCEMAWDIFWARIICRKAIYFVEKGVDLTFYVSVHIRP